MPGTAYRSFVRGRNHGHLRRYVQSVKSVSYNHLTLPTISRVYFSGLHV